MVFIILYFNCFMVSKKQTSATKKNIKKAQEKWKSMSSSQRALAQPEGRERKRPGAGGGNFYRINVRSKSQFVDFRTQDVGEKGHLERIAGKRKNGNWATQCWLVSKKDAVVRGGKLFGKTNSVKDLLKTLGRAKIPLCPWTWWAKGNTLCSRSKVFR